MKATLLIELLTEELPPKALEKLSTTFANEVFAALKEQALLSENSVCTPYATPRRLALSITEVVQQQPDRIIERKGPAVAAGLDAEGKPTKALEGFMRSAGVTFPQLKSVADGKTEYFVARIEQKGKSLDEYLQDIVIQALKKLPGAEADALGRFGAPVRASGAWADHPARQARGDGGSAGPDQRQCHQRPSLHVQRAGHDRSGGRL